uniref:Uncharacterized protein n=1 Tax=Candidozyma auris TaxID=498019 RepID=A0A0L0NNK6_CANAR
MVYSRGHRVADDMDKAKLPLKFVISREVMKKVHFLVNSKNCGMIFSRFFVLFLLQ